MGISTGQPLVLVETSNLPRKDWLAYRRKGIGGSDAAAVLGISPFLTGRDLYYDKLGISADADDENWIAKEIGNLLEPLVAKIFSERTGLKVYQKKFMFQHPQHPWMLADLDYLVEMPDGRTAILECKTSTSNAASHWWYAGKEIVPAYYESQGRHYMAVLWNTVVNWRDLSPKRKASGSNPLGRTIKITTPFGVVILHARRKHPQGFRRPEGCGQAPEPL